MKKRYIYLSWLVLCGWLLAVNGCGFKDLATPSSQGPAHTITDLAGREVVLPQSVARVVAIGPGALRFYCCINGAHNLVGVENLEKTNPVGRPYCLAHPSLGTLPVIGSGGPQNTPDLEKLMVAKPEVIFSTYTGDTAAIKALQAKTGIPVVALSYGQAGLFDPAIVASLTLIGKILGQEQKAEALTTYLKFAQQDLSSRTEKTPQAQKPNVYIGALGAKGAHGIESTQGCHAPFIAINAENVVDSTGKIGSVMIDKEQLIAWNPEVIFLDSAGLSIVLQDYQKNPQFYKALSAVQKGELYTLLPCNHYTLNFETALANAYFMGKVLYPQEFADINPVQKADEIYTMIQGQPLYNRMAKDFGGFRQISLTEGLFKDQP